LKKIYYDSKFGKSIKSLIRNRKLQDKIKARITLFMINKKDPVLRDHALIGKMRSYRAFSITGDIRIVYKEFPDHIRFIDIGTHNQVY
jgi:addiction module RelE/StbE family toxin